MFGLLANISAVLTSDKEVKRLRDTLTTDRTLQAIRVYILMLIILGMTVVAWRSGLVQVQESPVIKQWNTVREVYSDTLSHLLHFNDVEELQSGFVNILDYIRRSNQTQDFDSIKRDLNTKILILEKATLDLELREHAVAVRSLRESLNTITEDDWADPVKQQAVMMVVYNDISDDMQSNLSMSHCLRALTLGELDKTAKTTGMHLASIKSGMTRLKELRETASVLVNLVSPDLSSGILQMRLASHIMNVAPAVLSARVAMVLTGAGLVAVFGVEWYMISYLFDSSYAHFMSMQHSVALDEFGNLREVNTDISGGHFLLTIFTGQGVLYLPILFIMAVVMKANRKGSISGRLLVLTSDALSKMLRRRGCRGIVYSLVIGAGAAVELIPEAFSYLVATLMVSNVTAIAMWMILDYHYAISCLMPIYLLCTSAAALGCAAIVIALFSFGGACMEILDQSPLRWFASPNVLLGMINASSIVSILPEVGLAGYMTQNENYAFSLLTWVYSTCVPTRCIFYGICQ